MSDTPKNQTVLVVSDNIDGVRHIIAHTIQKRSSPNIELNLVMVDTPEEAITHLGNHDNLVPNVVFCDLYFGEQTSGFDLMKRVQGAISPPIPFVLVSGLDCPPEIQKELDGTLGQFIKLPLSEEVINPILNKHIPLENHSPLVPA